MSESVVTGARVHVISRGKAWEILRDGYTLGRFKTRHFAVGRAVRLAGGSEVFVHERDGSVKDVLRDGKYIRPKEVIPPREEKP